MDELLYELLKGWLMAQIIGGQQPAAPASSSCGCSCGECGGVKTRDLDDMNDLDDGRPYIWN